MSIRIAVTEQPPNAITPDYSDAFAVGRSSADARTALDWARAVFDHAPPPFRYGLPAAWRGLLGVRLGPRPSPDHVLGWRIVSSEPELALLEARAPLLAANLVMRLEPSRAVLTTFVHFEQHPAARPLFTIAGPVHRRVVPYLLGRAAAAQR